MTHGKFVERYVPVPPPVTTATCPSTLNRQAGSVDGFMSGPAGTSDKDGIWDYGGWVKSQPPRELDL